MYYCKNSARAGSARAGSTGNTSSTTRLASVRTHSCSADSSLHQQQPLPRILPTPLRAHRIIIPRQQQILQSVMIEIIDQDIPDRKGLDLIDKGNKTKDAAFVQKNARPEFFRFEVD